MNRGFTKLMAALALLTFLIPVAGWGQTFTRISTVTELADGDEIIFVNQAETYACGTTQNTNNRTPVAITTSSHSYTYSASDNVQVFVVRINSSGKYGFHTGTGYIYSASSSNNNLKTNTTPVTEAPSGTSAWSLSVSSNVFSCTNVTNSSYYLAFNGTSYFSQYKSGQSKPYIYKRTGDPVTYTVTLADDNTTLTQSSPGASVNLPTRSAIGAYTFAGWSLTNVSTETTTAPAIIPAGAYTPTDDITLYPVYTRTESGGTATEWHLTSLSAADAGVYALLTPDGHAFNGTISNGHGQATSDAFSFTDGVATTAPTGVCEITFVSVTGGFKMYNESMGYLYATEAASGKLSWHNSESSYWFYGSSNWKYNSNSAYLRTFNNSSFRTYGANNNDELKLAKKVEVAGTTTYYWSNPSTDPIINATDPAALAYNADGGVFGYSILNPVTGVTLNATSNSAWITNVTVNSTNSTVTFSTLTNTAYAQRTGTITLSYTGATDKVVTITQDAAPAPVINANNVSIAFDATSGSIAYSITNEPNPAGTMTAAVVSGGTIANLTIGTIANNTVGFTCSPNNTTTAHTATVTLTYTYDNNLTVTKNVTVTQAASSFEYALLPFAFDGNATAVADVAGLSQQGLDSYATQLKLQFNTTGDWLLLRFNERPGQLSYDIKGNSFSGSTFKVQASADGTNFTDVAIYTNLTSDIQHITINNLDANVRYIKWVYTNKNAGNVALGNIALAEYQPPQQYTLTVGTPQNVTIHVYNGNSHIATNNGSASVFSGTEITLNLSVFTGYVLDLVTVYDAQDNLISLTQVSETVFSFIMPSSNVTVSADVAGAHAPYNYTLATTFVPGKRYIIVAENYGTYYAMGAQKNNNRNAKPISVEGNTATVTRADVHEFTIGSIDGAPGYYSIYDEDPESHRYLYAGSSSSNSLRDTTQLIVHGKWAISIDANTSEASIVANANGANTHNVMRFNQANLLFSCYTANNNQYPVYLYVKEDGFALTIDGYTDDNVKDGYYLIASPVEVDPADVPGLTEGTFDLYYYDDSQDLEWINYETSNGINPDFGNLVPGKGYLYAKKAANGISEYTFTLTGEVYNGNGIVELEEGWNLIGNPWPQEAEFYADVFYVMNEQGSDIIPGEEYIAQPMQGFFAYDEYGGSTVEFIPSSSGAKAVGLSLNLTRDRGVIDRAIVRFGEGRQLPKFQLNPDNTKVYITQGDRDYAVVYSANEGELPVSFKAERNGTYTLSANLEGVSLDYLHLIDNLTGADVDLLVTPSYSFEARTTDYACRFRLVFSAEENDASTGSATFAFFNGSEWVVDNEGEATLQVIDVMGRVLSSETVNGNATISLEQTPGVYMLRLVTADGVKVQRVVVD